MKKPLAIFISAILTAGIISGCGNPTEISKKENLSEKYSRTEDASVTYNYNDGATEPPTTYNTYTLDVTDFEFKLFRNYYRSTDKKTFAISPYSIVSQLGTIANGASGDTQKEIINAIGNDLNIDSINECTSYFTSRMDAVTKSTTEKYDELSGKTLTTGGTGYAKFGNNLIFNDTISVKTKFLQTNANYYNAEVYRFLFKDENSLIKTNSLFNTFSDKIFDRLDNDNRLITVNYTDICDKWLNGYTTADESEGEFKSGEKTKTVKYMTSDEYYMQTATAEGIIKYMKDTPLKYIMIMPKESTSIDEYVSSFTSLEYNNLLGSIDITAKAKATIPQFNINEEPTAEEMNEVLTKSGLYTMFTDTARFANMSSQEEMAINSLYSISPKIEINLAGLGGTAQNNASEVISQQSKERVYGEKSIEINRPFIFMLIDNESNIPIYTGVVDLTE